MGLGSLRKVSLADARRKAAECHKLLDDHIDPIEHRTQARAAAALANAKSITFKEASTRLHCDAQQGLEEREACSAMGNDDSNLCRADLGQLLVRDIDVGHVHQVLEPI